MSETRLFAVTGSPIFQSKSPDIWNSAFEALKLDAVYFRIAAHDISDAVRISKEIGLSGINITAPYKEESVKFANDRDEHVKAIGAANSFIFNSDRVKAMNTDWQAVSKILDSKGLTDLSGKKALVIGAGGAARAAIYVLKKRNAEVMLTNRTEQKAKQIASFFNITHVPLQESFKKEYSITVSCIPYSNDVFRGLKTELLIDASYRGMTSTNTYIAGEEWLALQAEAFFREFFDAPPLQYMQNGLNRHREVKDNIALIGFMGAGKTLVGKMLAAELKYEFLDLDDLIEKKVGISISDIFNTKGVDHFRALEKKLLSELDLKKPVVFATGGGIVLDPENREKLKKDFNVVWLWADISTIRARVASDTRPLFNDNAAELLKHRTALYAKTCDLCVCNCHKSVNDVVKKIMIELK
jgi:shikimate dehydrogenase